MIGRQINFFFSPIDEDKFLQEVKKRGDLLVTDRNKIIGHCDVSALNINSHFQVWIRSPKSRINLQTNNILDRNNSEIIEYSRSISDSVFKKHKSMKISSPGDKRILKIGRLWAAMKFLEGENFVEKEEWFKDWYSSYANWIKKNSKISKSVYKDYIGLDAYSQYLKGEYILPDYYDWS